MRAGKEDIWNRVGDQSSWNQLTKCDTWWRAAPDHGYAFSDSTWQIYLRLWLLCPKGIETYILFKADTETCGVTLF